jgi:hypothetical protein
MEVTGTAVPPARPRSDDRRGGRGETSMVPPATPRSYYGQPILKAPVWTPEIPWYFFAGGLAGASALVASAARRQGNDVLARRALFTAAAAVSVSPVLLIKDLGRPERFHHMLRVVKVTSPMSIGSWVLSCAGTATGIAAGCEVLGILPSVQRVAESVAAGFGAPLATYTGALLANTAVPAWSEARLELPVIFGASSLASAGGAGAILTPTVDAGLARRLAIGGVAVELAMSQVVERHLGDAGRPYREGDAGRYLRAAKYASAAGAALLVVAGRNRVAAAAGGAAILAGGACERWGIFSAGVASARDPEATVGLQQSRLQQAR